MKRVALYDPYLDTLGGGEKHILSIIEVLADEGYEVTIFWDKNLNSKIKDRFALRHVDEYKYTPNIFKESNPVETFKALSKFDCFFYVTDGSYFASGARKNFVFSMVPDKKLYSLNIINRLKLWNYKFVSNSPFTTRWLKSWGIDPVTIPPFIGDEVINTNVGKKEKIILSVARFFPHLHSKNQAEIINAFKDLKKASSLFKDYRLVLAGGLKKEDEGYFDTLKKVAGSDNSIVFKTNLPKETLIEYYKKSRYFWHFAGLGVEENKHPDMVEHFGIAPLEAMATKAVAFCHNAGGPKEFINDGENGFLFSDKIELINKVIKVEKNEKNRERIALEGAKLVKKRYNYEVFKEKVLKLI
jgi:glycosyltransferase involved in cell wall biosynthesis